MARTCIFCGGRPLTKEHAFPHWLASLVTPPPGKRRYVDSTVLRDGVATKRPRRYPSTLDLQVRQVCGRCNAGWMNDLELAARPIIEALHARRTSTITPEQQLFLSSWAAKTAIMLQYLGSEIDVPARRRKFISEHHTPPPDTGVWVGRYAGDLEASTVTRHLFFGDADAKDLSKSNGQIVVFTADSLLFVVVTAYLNPRLARFRGEFVGDAQEQLFLIHPADAEAIALPSEGIDDNLRRTLQEGNIDDFFQLILQIQIAPLPGTDTR